MASIEPNNDLTLDADSNLHALGSDSGPIAADALGEPGNPIHGEKPETDNPVHTAGTNRLHILGATYGPQDVTAKVISLVNHDAGTLSVLVNNKTFGETYKGEHKSLTVVYRCGSNGKPKVSVTKEESTVNIRAVPEGTFDYDYKKPRKLQVLGASYGAADVTDKVRSLVSSTQTLDFTADDRLFTDTWHGVKKTFTIVARYTTGTPFTEVTKQGQKYSLKYRPVLSILGAVFGVDDVTSVVQKHVNRRRLIVKVDNATFGKGWTEQNSLSVLYQYGFQQPQLVTVAQGSLLLIEYNQPHKRNGPPPTGLEILGATYGITDVTEKARALVSSATGLSVTIPANTATFGEGWKEHRKSLAVFYRYGPSMTHTLAAREHDNVTIPLQGTAIIPLGGQHGFFHSDDQISISSSSNNQFWKVNPKTHQVSASEDSHGATTFKVTAQKDGGFLLRANDKYLTVSDTDGTITAGAPVSKASTFYLFALPSTHIVIGTSAGYCRLDESSVVIADCKSYFSLDCNWQVSLNTAEVPPHLAMYSAMAMDDCDAKLLKVAWDLTGALLLAMGIGPRVMTGKAQTGVLGLLKSNKRVWNAIMNLKSLVLQNKAAVPIAGFNILGLAYAEGLLWPIVRLILISGAWYIVGLAVAKIAEFLVLPAAGAIQMVASMAVWGAILIMDLWDLAHCKD